MMMMIICGEQIIIGSNFFKHQENWFWKRKEEDIAEFNSISD